MKPFFCYYGGKARGAKRYPRPQYTHIIEPFAGAAGYALRYHSLRVTLYDINPKICGLWDYLIHVTPEEIRRLPILIENVDGLNIPQEAKWLIGFWCNKATASPNKKPSSWMKSGTRPHSHWGKVIQRRIARQVERIRHWKVINSSYNEIDNQKVTWFIDPPYQGEAGKLYTFKIPPSEYEKMGNWCRERKGQVIVCEQHGADWLPFKSLGIFRASSSPKGKTYSHEVIWTNEDEQERGKLTGFFKKWGA